MIGEQQGYTFMIFSGGELCCCVAFLVLGIDACAFADEHLDHGF